MTTSNNLAMHTETTTRDAMPTDTILDRADELNIKASADENGWTFYLRTDDFQFMDAASALAFLDGYKACKEEREAIDRIIYGGRPQ